MNQNKGRAIVFLPLAALLLVGAGCTERDGPKETGGTLAGAALGGLLGAQFGSGSGYGELWLGLERWSSWR